MLRMIEPLYRLKYEMVRTPFERPLLRLRQILEAPKRLRHPELREIHAEPERIDRVIERLVKPSSNCIDVGCHYGTTLSAFCRRAPSGRHLAFEAIPQKARFLRRKFPEVEIREVALSDEPGRAAFYVRCGATGFSSLGRPMGGQVAEIEVECARLDDVAPSDRSFDMLKVDVEGAELPVFRGGRQTILQHRPAILFECGPGGPPSFGYSPSELYDFVEGQLHYSVFFLKDFLAAGPPSSREAFTRAITCYPFGGFNWVALPKVGWPLRP
jgi:FkbM family methyltransferase